MGQKVNPNIIRKGIVNGEQFSWYAEGKEYTKMLHQDLKVRNYLKSSLKAAGVSKVLIERTSNTMKVTIHAARPGVIIGKRGADIDKLKAKIQQIADVEISLNIIEVKKPEVSAELVALSIAKQLENRVSFRKPMKRAIQTAMRMGAKGIRVAVSGRLNGAEIARTEWYREGRVPLHTLRSKIEFARVGANTTYGVIGVKVWIYMGDQIEKSSNNLELGFKDEAA